MARMRTRRARPVAAEADSGSRAPTVPIFNDTYPDGDAPAGGSPTFRFFPRLPPEIRLKVWQSCLQQRRIIQLELAAGRRGGGGGGGDDDERAPPYTTRNELGRVLSGDEFHAFLHTYPPRCGLLAVCHEARQAALAFLRVRLPCYRRSQLAQWRGTGEPARPLAVYLNPEWDFLFITRYGSGRFLADFLHDLRAHDPRRRGAQHLVLRLPMFGGVNPRDVREPGRPAFVETLANLQSFWVDFSADIDWKESGPIMARVGGNQPPANRSLPVLCSSTAFDLLPRDPRPIDGDLRRMYHTLDTHRHGTWWQQLVAQFGVERAAPPDMRVLVAENGGNVVDRARFAEHLAPETRFWEAQGSEAEARPRRATAAGAGAAGAAAATAAAATGGGIPKVAGFWLFPPQAFAEGTDRFNTMATPDTVVDVSAHRPMLCVQDLRRS